jgi:CRP-like cAMP-binding protein
MEPKDFQVFQGLNETELNNFAAGCETESFPSGTEIITKGKSGDRVYILLEGQLRVFLPDMNGGGRLAEFGPGAIFGEMELLTEQPRVASVRAESDVKVWSMTFDAFRSRVSHNDPATLKVVFNVTRILATRLASTVENLAAMENGKTGLRSEDLRDFRRKLFSDWTF